MEQMKADSETAQSYKAMLIVHGMYYFGLSVEASKRSVKHLTLLVRLIREEMQELLKLPREIMEMIINNEIKTVKEIKGIPNLLLKGVVLTTVYCDVKLKFTISKLIIE